LCKLPAFAVLLTVLSDPRVIDDEMQQRIALIVPHIHRALRIKRAIDLNGRAAKIELPWR
jgi:hypothetical protein